MRILILLLITGLAVTPIFKGGNVIAQNSPDNAKHDTLSSMSSQPADSMHKPETGLTSEPKSNGKVQDPDDAKAVKPKTKPVEKAVKDTVKSTYISPDKGIGPIKEIKLGPIDTSMVSKGQQTFNSTCTACHQLDKKKIGPPLRNVTKERPPEFIMNMIVNTEEMQKKDPEVKKLIDQYGVFMSVLDINKDQARQLLEYLRWAAQQPPEK
jgi:cytochrome c1